MKKIALIIGNSSYPDSPLKNPVNDAEAIQEKLERLGFQVLERTDATNKQMEEALNDFSSKLNSVEVALFFFAGHGMQITGKNYLTAVDTNFTKEIDAKHSSLSLDKVIETMEGGSNPTNIIMLDACRNNPYERKWRGSDTLGLAPVYAPKGMIICYATSPGQVAFDGSGNNGAYTAAFLQHVSTPDLTIEDLFKRVRNTLSSSTRGKQISWEHTSLMGDFYFNYSFLTDELIPEYGDNALADANYQPTTADSVREIIEALKSHNWYVQNPAFSKMSLENMERFDKDDLFVLGRNIYQAACGAAISAGSFLNSLQTSLDRFPENISYHLLNGILYEIYFDSSGKFRLFRAKAEMIDSVFQIENSEKYYKSFEFIQQAIRPYLKYLFYIPSSSKGISVDISCVEYEKGQSAISEIFYEGDNVLYDEKGKKYFDPKADDFLRKTNQEEIREELKKVLVVPDFKLKINYLHLREGENSFLAPYRLNVRRV